WGSLCSAAEFLIEKVEFEADEALYQLNTHIDYRLSEAALEALDNGVPLTFELLVRVEWSGARFWEPWLLNKRMRYQIRYNAITELFRVVDLQEGEERNFVTRDAAISALGEINGLALLDRAQLEPGKEYLVWLKASLDIESLPLPLRPLAYLNSEWRLSSGWRQWPLRP
ncbi:hypothetical protein QQ73_21150, partial [Candidatus Endoriftia persephone str. Guaymas]|nr:hypothetical protein [Candidatus Endoriftia persephone str. Guaymas]